MLYLINILTNKILPKKQLINQAKTDDNSLISVNKF